MSQHARQMRQPAGQMSHAAGRLAYAGRCVTRPRANRPRRTPADRGSPVAAGGSYYVGAGAGGGGGEERAAPRVAPSFQLPHPLLVLFAWHCSGASQTPPGLKHWTPRNVSLGMVNQKIALIG